VRLELCVLPLANGSHDAELRSMLDEEALPIDTARIAPSAIASTVAVAGRERIADAMRQVPGVLKVLDSDPTLADLSWIGDRVSFHLCDEDMVLEVDPARLTPLDGLPIGGVSTMQQMLVAAGLWALEMPLYVTIDVEDRDKAARLLEQLAGRIFLEGGDFLGLGSRLDAYRLPDYREHAVYVISYQIHALKLRLHVALVGDQLAAATQPETLRQVIDAAQSQAPPDERRAHLVMRFNRRAIDRLTDDLELHWAEKARLACHRNTISIYNLVRLYDVPVEDVPRLADAKYGVTYFCPDGGQYVYDVERGQVECSVHGNRQHARQNPRLDEASSFSELYYGLDEIVASLLFRQDALIATIEIARSEDR
jgi:hypothetical protein